MIDTEVLRSWFLKNRRPLPWRDAPSAYCVLISEVMLQQTQADRVIGYFSRWMEQFATIDALATAPLETVMKVWEGLGYYSRARMLHSAARCIHTHYHGKLPDTYEVLTRIKGVGPYTARAILAFAFHRKCAAVDANVVRVLCRFFLIDEDTSKTKTKKKLQQLADSLLPEKAPWEISEALIELGALHCKPRPQCIGCPLHNGCRALKANLQCTLPKTGKKIVYEKLYRDVAVVIADRQLLVRQVEQGKVFAGLWEFPYCETTQGGGSFASVAAQMGALGLELEPHTLLPEEKHSFTRFRVVLYPKLFTCSKRPFVTGYSWLDFDQLFPLPFSSGHRRILAALKKAVLV